MHFSTSVDVPPGPFVRSSALPVYNETVGFGSGLTSPFMNAMFMLQNDNIALEGTERVVLSIVNIESDNRIVIGGSFSGLTFFPETNISIVDDNRTSL